MNPSGELLLVQGIALAVVMAAIALVLYGLHRLWRRRKRKRFTLGGR